MELNTLKFLVFLQICKFSYVLEDGLDFKKGATLCNGQLGVYYKDPVIQWLDIY